VEQFGEEMRSASLEEADRDLRAAESGLFLPPPPAVVTALATTPVKGLHLCPRSEVTLTRAGVVDNRCFYVVDEDARMVNGKRIGILGAVRADYDPGTERLTMTLPDGTQADGVVRLGAKIETRFFSSRPIARLAIGPWSELLSRYAGKQLRLVYADPEQGAVDRGPAGAVTLISDASIERLEALAGKTVDARRFRMLIGIAGVEAHEEDGWVGRTMRIGTARVAFHGHVGRCLVTSQSPDTGIVDLPTLDLLASYRRDLPTTEPLAFGIYGEVVQAGIVRLGDGLTPD
jgi:uncharacterized protein YcbX